MEGDLKKIQKINSQILFLQDHFKNFAVEYNLDPKQLFEIINILQNLVDDDLYNDNQLKDKPNSYASKKLESLSGLRMEYYIGDNDLIDREFSISSNSKFILANYSSDMAVIVKSIL